ncbi:NmrA family transcriptional regulator [Streptomyces roseirectus]|uniref:NmrA family transcriptional regulator n=1 Tax=Streptomyces roseirectus TaxID=2768066 RepID=A0A7H0I9L5_9ACTN|nr:NmrA family transcriptional regulator [Streptomyces roseirectus]QNP69481.1 NmrA family transcriptional regulator [Streptomyces roseirectus]
MTNDDLTLVVTGATGRTGGRVARAAEAAGLRVRPASRATGFAWDDPTTWADTLRGADAAYLVYPPDIGVPGAAGAVGALAREAVALGVRRLVLLSGRGQGSARPAEEALIASGAEWTIVRASWFTQNFSEGPMADGLRFTGDLVFPADEVTEPFLDLADVAEVVVRTVVEGQTYVGRALDLSGPRLMTFREAVAEIGRAAGRELTYTPVTSEQYAEVLTGFGLPSGEVAFLVGEFGSLLDGHNSYSSADGVREVLGRAPRDFTEFARDAAAEGAWKV